MGSIEILRRSHARRLHEDLLGILGVSFDQSKAGHWRAETFGGTSFNLVETALGYRLNWKVNAKHRLHESDVSAFGGYDDLAEFLETQLQILGWEVD